MQEMDVLSSYGSARHLECSALRNVMSCDIFRFPPSTAPLVSPNSTKAVFDAERRNPLRAHTVNFPKCLCPEVILVSPSGEAGWETEEIVALDSLGH